MNKNQKIYVALGVIAVILIIIFTFNAQKNASDTPKGDDAVNPPQGKLVTGTDLQTFSGTISAVDTGCFVDATCSVTVDGKKIILVQGGRGLAPETVVGRLIGVDSIGDLEQKIGEHANVYAGLTTDGNYTLYGNSSYYVEVVTISDK